MSMGAGFNNWDGASNADLGTGINKMYKFDEVILVAEESKKSVHSRATDLFFGFLRREKDESRCIFYYSPVP
jgi:hypothetical protein